MISYGPLLRLLESRNIKMIDLVRECKLSTATVAKISKNEPMNITTIARICRHLNVPIERVVEVNLD